MSVVATTRKHRELMEHAVDAERRRRNSFKKRYRLKPDEFRNYYCASVGGEDDRLITELVAMGLMKKGHIINDGREFYAHVTEAGLEELGLK